MSASQTPPPDAAGNDPSMEDILASIRRILSEDETPPAAEAAPPATAPPANDGVLVLDPAMMIPEAPSPQPAPAAEPPAPVPVVAPAPPTSLVAPEAAAAAASSVGSLVRTLTERSTQVRTGGPTIEDIVREEIRPLLKEWLDTNLPALVERLVRAEIERVVGRAVP
jgi:cell pole-organizing protein PopZ